MLCYAMRVEGALYCRGKRGLLLGQAQALRKERNLQPQNFDRKDMKSAGLSWHSRVQEFNSTSYGRGKYCICKDLKLGYAAITNSSQSHKLKYHLLW